jgi:hypothetical protein
VPSTLVAVAEEVIKNQLICTQFFNSHAISHSPTVRVAGPDIQAKALARAPCICARSNRRLGVEERSIELG